jgi:hypothetical protein
MKSCGEDNADRIVAVKAVEWTNGRPLEGA